MKSKTLIKIAFLCLLAGVGLISFRDKLTGFSTFENGRIVSEPYKSIDLYFCEKDDCESIESNLIDSSKRADCAFYDIDLEKIISSLSKKEYRLVTDNTADLNIYYKKDTNKALMHNKFCVLDNKIISGSFNPKKSSLFKDYNNLIVIESDYLVKNYENEFEELWNGIFSSGEKVKYPVINYGGTRIENYFCPEDNCEEKLLNVLNNGNEINFLIFSFTSSKVSNKLIEKFNSGSIVSGVVEKQRINMQYEKYKELKKAGIDIRADSNPNLLHDKTFIINNEIIVIGSYNPTGSGNTKNDENMLIIYNKDLAGKMKQRFNDIYSKSEAI